MDLLRPPVCSLAQPFRAGKRRGLAPPPSHLFHNYPQLCTVFCLSVLDVEIKNIYLARQIEPEEEDFMVRFGVSGILTDFAILNAAVKLKDFTIPALLAQPLNRECSLRWRRKLREVTLRGPGSNGLAAVAALPASQSSEAWRFGFECGEASLLRSLGRITSSQVVRISLEDAISRKAVGHRIDPERL